MSKHTLNFTKARQENQSDKRLLYKEALVKHTNIKYTFFKGEVTFSDKHVSIVIGDMHDLEFMTPEAIAQKHFDFLRFTVYYKRPIGLDGDYIWCINVDDCNYDDAIIYASLLITNYKYETCIVVKPEGVNDD